MNLSSNLLFLLKRRGQTATFTSVGSQTYDPTTGGYSSSSTAYTVKAYFGEYKLGEANVGETANGTRWVVFGPVDTSGNTLPKPNTKDTISGVGDNIIVLNVQTIYNGSSVVCYLCEAAE